MKKKKETSNIKNTITEDDFCTPVVYDPPHIPNIETMRDYQKEALDAIEAAGDGNHLVVMATGLGKTYVFSHIPRRGRVLILSHRDELVHQPEKYYDCSFGVEQAKEISHGEEVISASVQSLVRRLDRFDPNAFDMIITDEAHHSVADTYKKIYDHFKPRVHLGFTATPNRYDKKGLQKIYDDIIFNKDIKFGIKNHYLSDIKCLRVDVGFNLRGVKTHMGDFNQKNLGEIMDQPEVVDAVAEAYYKYAKGQTLIFAVDIEHATHIAEKITGAVVVSAKTKNRSEIIEKFTNREIPCIVNCMVFTEGTDIPLIETVIMARPTLNETLYAQCVGRGLRLYEGKEFLTLIDCVGVSRLQLCTAPMLMGLNPSIIAKNNNPETDMGFLSEMEQTLHDLSDIPESWIENIEVVKLFSEENDLDLHEVNWMLMPDESMMCSVDKNQRIIIPPTDARGLTRPSYMIGQQCVAVTSFMRDMTIQEALDVVYEHLKKYRSKSQKLWSANASKAWGDRPITEKQLSYIKSLMKQCKRPYAPVINTINQREAGFIISRLQYQLEQSA